MASAWNWSKSYFLELGRVAVLWNATNPYAALVYKQTQAAGRTLGIEVQSLEVRGPDDFEGAFETTRQQHSDALITVEDPLTGANRDRIVHFAAVDRLPSLYGNREEVVAGGLMSYGANFADLFRRAAGYVDKILKELGQGFLAARIAHLAGVLADKVSKEWEERNPLPAVVEAA